jgi:heptosyltransferase-1
MRILLVKLSSMGDVVHNLPVLTDIRRALPEASIDWAVEPAFAPLVTLHPAVRETIAIPLRAVKARWWSPRAWRALRDARATLGGRAYDLIVDTQGLVKSAWIARAAQGPVAGYDAASAREPAAARQYSHRYPVAREAHAVARNRTLAAAALGYALPAALDYGIHAEPRPPGDQPYVVCLTDTSRADKEWPAPDWRALIERINDRGRQVLLPWGSARARAANEALAARVPDARVPDAMPLDRLAGVLAAADAVVGVDTGLTHLAVALRRPTLGLYVSTRPALTGLCGAGAAINLGGGTREHPAPPRHDEAWAALAPLLDLR